MHPVIHRTLVTLSVTYAIAWAGAAMAVGPGSATLVALTGDLANAGLFVALFSVSAAAGAFILGRLMDRYGRKGVLIAAHLVAATGYTIAGAGSNLASAGIFAIGGGLFAFGFGGILLTRMAAAEIFPALQRGRGVGWVQVSATVGAVAGPVLLILSDPLGNLLGRDPLEFVWFFAPPLHLFAALFLSRATEPQAISRDLPAYHPETRNLPVVAPVQPVWHLVPVTVVALAANQAAMVTLMGIAGAAVHQAGHAVWVLGVIMAFHFFGMFGLSPVVGRIADRFGRRNTILTGIAVLATGGLLIASVPGVWGYGAGLVLVGFGWSFGFIGATVLLSDVVPDARRARIFGRADLSAQLSAAVVSLAAGWWFAVHGATGLGLLAAGIVVLPAVLMVVYVREQKPGDFRASLGSKRKGSSEST